MSFSLHRVIFILSFLGMARALPLEAEEYYVEDDSTASPPPEKAPPLPFHTIEGVGGGGITPMAYLVNPAIPDTRCYFAKPAVSTTFINAGRKSLEAVAVSEAITEHFELSYAVDRFGIGSLEEAIDDRTGIDIAKNDVWLHNFNFRYLLVKENEEIAGFKTPAITAGLGLKYNAGIATINDELHGALTGIGYRRPNGEDYTLTATKMFPKSFLERPLIVTAGLRLSEAADVGFLGFSDTYHASFEGNICYLPKDWLLVGYEFRQKTSPYDQIPDLIGPENNWHAVDAAFILSKQATFVAGWAALGNLADTVENGTWFFQLKYEL
jgi:hypothetical protein